MFTKFIFIGILSILVILLLFSCTFNCNKSSKVEAAQRAQDSAEYILEQEDLRNSIPPDEQDPFIPPNGFVPNEYYARKIAEVIFRSMNGPQAYSFKPYSVILSENKLHWIVKGTLKKDSTGLIPYLELNRIDCRILKVDWVRNDD